MEQETGTETVCNTVLKNNEYCKVPLLQVPPDASKSIETVAH